MKYKFFNKNDIMDYLNNITYTNDYFDAFLEIKNFCEFLEKEKYIMMQDDYIELIKENNNLNHLLRIIVNNTQKNNNDLYKINKNQIFIDFIECYCMINNIDVLSIEDTNSNYEVGEQYGDIDLLKLFISEVNKIPMLTKEEEQVLLKKRLMVIVNQEINLLVVI